MAQNTETVGVLIMQKLFVTIVLLFWILIVSGCAARDSTRLDTGKTYEAVGAIKFDEDSGEDVFEYKDGKIIRLSTLSPDNYAIRFDIGMAYLRKGERDAAIQQWEKYLALAPDNSKSVSVRERLTVLKIRQATDFAKEAVKRGPGEDLENRLKTNTVAVLNFKNVATPDLIPFIKGLTAMVITDLAKVPELRVVERVKMQALMDEMRIGATGLVDPATACKAGQLLLARNIAWGEMGVSQKDDLQIVSIVTETLNHQELGKTTIGRPRQEFFKLEKEIVFKILDMLGLKKEDLDPSVLKSLRRIHTTNMRAFMSFGRGLHLLDQMQFAQASQAFNNAVKLDPQFNSAHSAAQSTPRSGDVLKEGSSGPHTQQRVQPRQPQTTPQLPPVITPPPRPRVPCPPKPCW